MNPVNALYIVATPIGNLDDISSRALKVLARVDLIGAEDTRHSAKLLNHYDIKTPLVPYHDHGGEKQVERLLTPLLAGKSVALISDAGTPLIADPGYRLVEAARMHGQRVIPIPGACAFTTALSASGLPSDRFAFEGFLPPKQTARIKQLEQLKRDSRTLIFYEAPHRILDVLGDLAGVCGSDRKACLARELSKTYETFICGTLADIRARLQEDPNQQKGEMVLLLAGHIDQQHDDADMLSDEVARVVTILAAELPASQAASLAAKITKIKKQTLYQFLLNTKS